MSFLKKLVFFLNDLKTTKKLVGSFAILVLVVLGVSGVAAISLSTIRNAVEMTDFSNEVLDGLDELRFGLMNQENGLRGYIITGDALSLAPYKRGIEQYEAALEKVRGLLSINPEQIKRLDAVERFAERWRTETAERLIALAGDPATRDQALEWERQGRGAGGTIQVFSMTDRIEQVEKDFLAARAAEADRAFHFGFLGLAVGGIVGVMIAVLMAWALARGIVQPVVGMTGAMRRLADGDKTVEIPARGRKDEVGQMAAAVEVFGAKMIEAERLTAEQEQERAAREERARRIETLTREFDEAIATVLAQVGAASAEMQSTAASMSATAEETNRQAVTVAAASEQAAANVQSVASASEQLSSSIREISRQVSQSAAISQRASEDAQRTNEQVGRLSEAAQKIGEVVSLIQDIAAQTNLLALNATIEAARAGEAGKGFAVVASEVKTLANQTAKATEEIGLQIGGIQGETAGAVEAIQEIGRTIAEINHIASSIASAVEEQDAATREISRNVQEAARGTQEVSSNITGVTEAAGETGAAAEQVNASAGNLGEQSDQLRKAVEDFLAGVRAA